jgi:hypothetical protein
MTDVWLQGVEYLQKIQGLALDSRMINTLDFHRDRVAIYSWIGTHIHQINATLQTYGKQCAECWPIRDRPNVQIWAAPIVDSFAIDGCCNLGTSPVTLLIDVGRVIPAHWQRLVVHEYAHASVGRAGHTLEFTQALAHLCLGLGLPTPDLIHATVEQIQSFPPCTPTFNPLDFWQGKAIHELF